MSRIIIGVHGLGNKPPIDVLEKWWRLSLQEGFKNASLEAPPIELKLAYWADLLHPQLLDPSIQDPKHELYIDEQYTPKDPMYHGEKAGDFRRRVMNMIGGQLDNIFLRDDLTINFSSVSDFIVQRFFKDLAAYYQTFHKDVETKDTQLQSKIRQRLADVLYQNRKRKIILIAHSMGSLVAYDTLTQVVPDIAIDTFITIGSPLGIPTIRSKIASEALPGGIEGGKLKTPENVRRKWYNFADLKDKIALYYHLADEFVANSYNVNVIDQTILNDYIYNGEKNPHKAYGYLRTNELISKVQEFYDSTTPEWIQWVERQLKKIKRKFPRWVDE